MKTAGVVGIALALGIVASLMATTAAKAETYTRVQVQWNSDSQRSYNGDRSGYGDYGREVQRGRGDYGRREFGGNQFRGDQFGGNQFRRGGNRNGRDVRNDNGRGWNNQEQSRAWNRGGNGRGWDHDGDSSD